MRLRTKKIVSNSFERRNEKRKKRKNLKRRGKAASPSLFLTIMNQGKEKESKSKREPPKLDTVKSWVKNNQVYCMKDMLFVSELDQDGEVVYWYGPDAAWKTAKVKMVASDEKWRRELAEKKVHTGAEWSRELNLPRCKLCGVPVSMTIKTAFDSHFGFNNNAVNVDHLKRLKDQLDKVNGGEVGEIQPEIGNLLHKPTQGDLNVAKRLRTEFWAD